MADLQIDISRNATKCFCDLLTKSGIVFDNRTQRPPPGVIFASGVDIIAVLSDKALWGALAAVIITWIRARSRRKVIVTTNDDKIVHVEGYSVEELERLLMRARRMSMLEIPEKKPTEQKA